MSRLDEIHNRKLINEELIEQLLELDLNKSKYNPKEQFQIKEIYKAITGGYPSCVGCSQALKILNNYVVYIHNGSGYKRKEVRKPQNTSEKPKRSKNTGKNYKYKSIWKTNKRN
jgi:predicted nucleic acid-binding Zn ribbon protein